jgi:hypothetical protein
VNSSNATAAKRSFIDGLPVVILPEG